MRIDLDAMLEAARRRVGASEITVDPIDLEGLRLLAADAATAAEHHRADPASAIDWVAIWIDNQAKLQRRLAEAPALSNTPVPAPIFIVSGARTGSTLLQTLLALDPGLRSPKLWELRAPFPPTSREELASMRAGAAEFVARVPGAAQPLHPIAVDAPEECHWLLRHNSSRATFHVAWRYWEWLQALDEAELFRLFADYRRHVQILQAPDPGRRWLSKAFAHAHFWPVLHHVFPDARVIRIHRDPRASVGSSCSLVQALLRQADPIAVGELVVATGADGVGRMLAAPPASAIPPIDVLYSELVGDPAATVTRLAAELGLDQSLGDRARRYLASPKRLRAAPHAYELEAFGLTHADVGEAFEGYIDWVRAALDPSFAR